MAARRGRPRKQAPQAPVKRSELLDPADALGQDISQTATDVAQSALQADAYTASRLESVRAEIRRRRLERELEVVTRTVLAEERTLALESLWYFTTEILFPKVWRLHYSEKFHKPILQRLQGLKNGEDFWAIVSRESRKSFLLDIAASIWDIVRDPNIRLLLVGAREDTVKPFARMIRGAFIAGTPGFEKFQEVFSDYVWQPGESMQKEVYQFTCRLRTVSLPDPTFRATYLGVSGAGWRCDRLRFDDPIERRNVSNPEMSQKTFGQMLDLLPLVDSTSQYRNVIGMLTRWNYFDPGGKIIGENWEGDSQEAIEARKRIAEGRTTVIVRHAAEDPERPCEHCPPHITAGSPHGHPISPFDPRAVAVVEPALTLEVLQQRFQQYSVDPTLGESMWWHHYQNVCLAPSDQKFQPEWFVTIERPTWADVRRRVLTIDSADKDFQKPGVGDFMVAAFGDFNERGRLCLRHGLRSNRWTRMEFIKQIMAWCMTAKWWPHLAVKEKFGTDTFLSDLQRAFAEQGQPVRVVTVTRPTGVKKNDWIVESLQGPFEKGEFVLGAAFPLTDRLVKECCTLGQIAHEDLADCIALMATPGVRVSGVDKLPSGNEAWQPPELGLYDAGLRPAISPFVAPTNASTPLQLAARRMEAAIVDINGSSEPVLYDTPATPERFSVTLGDYE